MCADNRIFKAVFIVWNSQQIKEAAKLACEEFNTKGYPCFVRNAKEFEKKNWNSKNIIENKLDYKLEIVIKDVQSINHTNQIDDLIKENADVYVIYQMGKGEWEKKLVNRAKVIAFKSSIDNKSFIDKENHIELYKYLAYDGLTNLKNFIIRCLILSNPDINIKVEKPIKMPWNGIYHPLADRCFEDVHEYFKWYLKKFEKMRNNKPKALVAILFYRARYLFNNTSHVDLLIKNLESRNIGVIPVFCLTFPDKDVGMPGIEYVIKKYILPANPDLIIWGLYFRVSREIELLRKLDVPILNAIELYAMSPEEWMEKPSINVTTISMAVAMPEFDGVINPTVFSGEIRTPDILKAVPIEERVNRIAEQADRWIKLRKLKNKDKKVAIILHCSTIGNSEANSGTALGLDSFASVVEILIAMAMNGYHVELPELPELELFELEKSERDLNLNLNSSPKLSLNLEQNPKLSQISNINPKAKKRLAEWLSKKLSAVWTGKWQTSDKLCDKHVFDCFNTSNKAINRVVEKWGDLKGIYKIPGVFFGNIFVTVQPLRCGNDLPDDHHKLIHDPVLPPPPKYIAFYDYINNNFHAAIHVGKHGSVEWLPGKSVGLSCECYPDLCLKSIPNMYIYIVNNPAEGTQAKRRGYSTIIDHLPPVMEIANLYEDLEIAIEEYLKAKERKLKKQMQQSANKILELASKYNFELNDLPNNLDLSDYDLSDYFDTKEFFDFVNKLHSKLQIINCSLFNKGLHIFGSVRDELKIALSVVRPDIELKVSAKNRKSVIELYLNTLELRLKCKENYESHEGKKHSKNHYNFPKNISDEITENGLINSRLIDDKLIEKGIEVINRLRNIKEMQNLLKALSGKFVEPAPSGDLTKGRIDVIPTGFNFYSVDPKSIPTRSAWDVGKKLAKKLFEKYLREEGRLPETVAFIQWTSDPMNTDGEQIAQILYTLGVKPVWDGKRVVSLKVIPLEELKRPRIDVFLRISGLFRDTFMNLVEIIDSAITMVAKLDEPVEMNFVKKHFLEGINHRIFGDMPGAYGAGVNHAVNSSLWNERDELADVFIEWGMYVYGKGVYGKADKDSMVKAMKKVDAVVRNHYTDEWDVFSDDCPYAFQGGLGLAVEKVRGIKPKLYISDTRPKPGGGERIVDVEEEVERIARITLLNDRWVDGMKKHGYKGAGDIMKRIVNMFGWEVTADAVKDWIFEEVARKYVLNKEMREWLLENNPYSIEEIARRLLEAYKRGLWNTSEELMEEIEEAYMDVEGYLEDL